MAITAPWLWLDGALVTSSDAGAPLMGHAVQRGSLVFDVGSFQMTERGPALFRARDNVARFIRSAGIVGLTLGFDAETLLRAAIRVVAESGHTNGLVRWSAFYAAREPDLVPQDEATHVAVAAQSLESPSSVAPIRIAIFDEARKASREVLPPEAKVAAAYLGPMLARRRAIAAGANDVVLLDRDGEIAEAPIANAFAVVSGAIWTPPLGRILPGITRETVLALARAEGLEVREERLPLDVFAAADEAFLTSTSMPIAPISHVNERALPGAPGPITARLIERVAAAQRGAIAGREEWLTLIDDRPNDR
jgi:branched-chain amino acid aminotransferase